MTTKNENTPIDQLKSALQEILIFAYEDRNLLASIRRLSDSVDFSAPKIAVHEKLLSLVDAMVDRDLTIVSESNLEKCVEAAHAYLSAASMTRKLPGMIESQKMFDELKRAEKVFREINELLPIQQNPNTSDTRASTNSLIASRKRDEEIRQTTGTSESATFLHPPAKCRSCGEVFPATDFALQDVKSATFANCTVAPCPICGGGPCDVLEGVYNAEGDVLTLLSGPQSTIDALRKAAQTAVASREAGETVDQTIERVAEILPSFERFKGRAKSAMTIIALGALSYIGTKLADVYIDPLLNPPELNPAQVHAIVTDAVSKAFADREMAEQKAGVRSLISTPPPPRSIPKKRQPRSPQFQKTMEDARREVSQHAPCPPPIGSVENKNEQSDDDAKRKDGYEFGEGE